MSTPSLNAEKWLLPTVLLYCRRTLQHLTPHAEISLCPRGCLVALSLSFSYIVLYCFQCFYFSHIILSNHWCRPLCYWFHHLSRHAPTGVYIFGCHHRMACLLSGASTAHYESISSPFAVKCIRSTVCFLLVDFPVFWLSAQRSGLVPQLRLHRSSLTNTLGLQW